MSNLRFRIPQTRAVKNRRRFLLCTGEAVNAEESWKYPEAHIVGDLRQANVEEREVTCLALWVTPVDNLHVPPLQPEVAAYIIGEARHVRCRFEGCGKSICWEEVGG